MEQYSLIGIILAIIGILKGKDIWDFLKFFLENKNKSNEKVVKIYAKQIEELKERIKSLEEKQEVLVSKLQDKITKSRGRKKQNPENTEK